MLTGRNDPCPCGSGRKYKKCHGALEHATVASPLTARATALKARDVELGDRIMRFARLHYGPRWMDDALDSEDLLDDGVLSDAEMPFVIPWLLHFKRDAAGMILPDVWSRLTRDRIAPDERLLLDAYGAAWASIWEVTEVQPGVGSRLTDVLTREERFIHDVRSTSTLQRFDSLLAIVLDCDGVSFFGGIHAQPLTPRFADVVVREARRMCRVRTRPVAVDKLRYPDLQLELLMLWSAVADDMVNQPPPSLQNTDGDPFVVTRDDFALLTSANEVAHRLATLPGAQDSEAEGDDTVFVVTRPGNATHRSWDNTVVGRLVLSATRLTIETNSTRRADSLRALVETQVHGLVRFRLRTEENTTQLLAEAHASPAPRTSRAHEHTSPDELAAIREFREQHMRDWVDMALPALDGHTPRQSAHMPRLRQRLEVLVKELELSDERLPEEQRMDLRPLREALDIR